MMEVIFTTMSPAEEVFYNCAGGSIAGVSNEKASFVAAIGITRWKSARPKISTGLVFRGVPEN